MQAISHALDYAQANRDRFVDELKQFVRFPSISAQPQHAEDVRRCANWLAGKLRKAGLERVQVVSTKRHPIVLGRSRCHVGMPTVLIYGHYDVQPVDPLKDWSWPPFKPIVRDNNLHGRGASDDKGQLFTHVKAIEAYLSTIRRLPVNLTCLFEGEEEIGSPHLPDFIRRNKRLLAADVAVMSDTRMLGPKRPVITYALRGALRLEVEVRGGKKDLHSGQFGGAVHNPVQAICEIIARLYEPNGRVAVPGFYDRVKRWTTKERQQWARRGPTDQDLLRDAEACRGWGEESFTLFERTTIRPALNVNGIGGGYQGPGSKSVIPARALAKLGVRLAAGQQPSEIARLLCEHIARVTPPSVTSAIRVLYKANPVVLDRRHPAMSAAARAYRRGFGALPVFLPSGGTIPIVDQFKRVLGIPTLLMGFALPNDNLHAPNEKFHLDSFHQGIVTCLWLLDELQTLRNARTPDARSTRAMSLEI